MFSIYYDDIQEGTWFQSLHDDLEDAELVPLSNTVRPKIQKVLSYDRPDIVLADSDDPILVIERTIEVPSGHNVGQRFARLAAAAQCKLPIVYFGPYAAYKHGGATQGPRYMNLRLFYALDLMSEIEDVAITTINWPVDENYEIIRSSGKDCRIKEYLNLFFSYYYTMSLPEVNASIIESEFEQEQLNERELFIRAQVKNPEQYDIPPSSVFIGANSQLPIDREVIPLSKLSHAETILYNIGTTYIRSDPYAGMTMLYDYLYAGGPHRRTRNFILHMPNITKSMWNTAANSGRSRKDIRLYKLSSDGILFKDGYVDSELL